MKAVLQYEYGGPEVLAWNDTEIPSAGDHEVLIKVKYTSVNFADVKKRKGSKGKGAFPFILGLDAAGIIEEAAPNSAFSKGDRVIAFPKSGAYAEYSVVNEQLVFKIPDSLSWEQAAAMPTVSILAYILLHTIGQVKKTDVIVIHSAAGGAGSMLVQLAKLAGVRTVIGTTGNPAKYPYIEQLGADYVYSYDIFSKKVVDVTNGEGAQLIFDSAAGEITSRSLECLALYGTLVPFGSSSGESSAAGILRDLV